MGDTLSPLAWAEWLSLRDAVRLLLVSGLFAAVLPWAFRRNAPSRRAMLLAASLVLVLLPIAIGPVVGVWTVPIEAVPGLTLATPLPQAVVVLWFGVAGALLAVHAVRSARALRSLARLPVLDDARVAAATAALAKTLGVPMPSVRVGAAACSKTLFGRMLVLPPAWRHWDPATLRSVLAHELVHTARLDDRWLLVTRIVCLVHWWIPWVRTLHNAYVQAMEESCDDAASALIGREATYLDALVGAAGIQRRAAITTAMHAHHLVARIERFSQRRAIELDTASVYWLVLGVLAVGIGVTSFEPVALRQAAPTAGVPVELQQFVPEHRDLVRLPVVRQSIRLPAGASRAERLQVGAISDAPRAIYPGLALRRAIEGDVVVEYSINRDGTTARPRVLSSTPAGVFDAAALRAVRNLRHSPLHIQDVLVDATRADQDRPPTRVQRLFRFRLDDA